jgi:hypothetical protein
MNTTPVTATMSWIQLIGSPQTVLGPSRGHVPDLTEYRISNLHFSPHALWIYGAVTGLPIDAECNGENRGLRTFNLALDVSVREVRALSGQPQLDPDYDDTNHGFQAAMPVAVSIAKTDELVYPDGNFRVLQVVAASTHLRFDLRANFITAYGGKHAHKRYADALRGVQ